MIIDTREIPLSASYCGKYDGSYITLYRIEEHMRIKVT